MEIQVASIHRRSNGTVDTDLCRQKAFLLRREATNQILRRIGCFIRSLPAAVAILMGHVLLLPRNPVPQRAIPVFTRAKVSPQLSPLKTSKSNHRSQ
jgi:hypothetical protein